MNRSARKAGLNKKLLSLLRPALQAAAPVFPSPSVRYEVRAEAENPVRTILYNYQTYFSSFAPQKKTKKTFLIQTSAGRRQTLWIGEALSQKIFCCNEQIRTGSKKTVFFSCPGNYGLTKLCFSTILSKTKSPGDCLCTCAKTCPWGHLSSKQSLKQTT